MMMKTNVLLLFMTMVFLACGSHSNKTVARAQSRQLDDLVATKSFEIVSDWASPMGTTSMNNVINSGLLGPGNNAGHINLIGNSNYLRVEGDSVSAYLPYFGERQMGGGYDSDGGNIQFEGVPEDYEIKQDEQTKRYEISFKINRKIESFTVRATLMPNLSSTVNITSSQRFPIRYRGNVSEISKK
ncbi:DUF4251 domain-containing protein [uncultured Kriegella sp.]|uniref:DUF4251 domain-containing protein n=1 Tax=uncultured Kriegella sp. TaxID=1798910 RepID=UPI0030DD563E|tara:strand:- start:71667 stop:72224 length:558 start_codon:yes stop_codon:yes gene_type:complete